MVKTVFQSGGGGEAYQRLAYRFGSQQRSTRHERRGVYPPRMRLFQSLAHVGSELKGWALCLGNFDGVHRGHQALFAKASQEAPAAALTFEPHPGKVLQPQLAPKLITSLERKLELMGEYGLRACVVQPFDREYAARSPADFERSLLVELGAAHLVVGSDFTYGARRAGTVETLRQAAQAHGAKLHVVAPVTVDGVVVSSSRVREYVLEGRVEAAEQLMGHAFDVDGTVVKGFGRGRQIGFPTANVQSPNELLPAPGVYAVEVRLDGEQALRRGAANLGVKPTFGATALTLEVHLIDFDGDLYGRLMRAFFRRRLREERRFPSLEALMAQIKLDVEAARGPPP